MFFFFFFNDTATTEIYTLSLHDALPIWRNSSGRGWKFQRRSVHETIAARRVHSGDRSEAARNSDDAHRSRVRSEEHTSELQSQSNLVCRLLLEKKKNKTALIELSKLTRR